MNDLCAPIWWLSWARKRAEVVVSWYILCYGTSLGMASCFADLRATSPRSMFKRLCFYFLFFFKALLIPEHCPCYITEKSNHKTKWTWVENLSSFLSFLSPPPKGDEFLLDLSAQIAEVQRWRVNLFSVNLVMSLGYISRRFAVNRTPSSPSHSLCEWKRRPVCHCSTASLDSAVLGLPLSEALRALFCSGVSSTKSTQAFGWSGLSSSPQTSPLACNFKITRERSMLSFIDSFVSFLKKNLVFIPGWTGTHN